MTQRQNQRGGSDFYARRQRRRVRQIGDCFQNRAVINDVLAGPERIEAEFFDGADLVRLPEIAATGNANTYRHDSLLRRQGSVDPVLRDFVFIQFHTQPGSVRHVQVPVFVDERLGYHIVGIEHAPDFRLLTTL